MPPAGRRFWQDETGASAVEYCILVSFIAVVIVAAITTLGSVLSNQFASMATSLGS